LKFVNLVQNSFDMYAIKARSLELTEDEFFNLCQENDFLRFERTADKQILVMTPSGIETGYRNSNITTELSIWNRKHKLGYVFDSSAGFTLPNGAVRSPDASWLEKSRYEALPKSEKQRFAHICPDFLIELKSPSDDLSDLKAKMEEWIANGCQMAWLINPEEQKSYIYQPNKEVEIVKGFDKTLSGMEILKGFELELKDLK